MQYRLHRNAATFKGCGDHFVDDPQMFGLQITSRFMLCVCVFILQSMVGFDMHIAMQLLVDVRNLIDWHVL